MITILMIQSVRFTSVANSYMKEKIEGNYFCDGTRTHNHLFRKQTLNHFAKLAKWLSCVVSTYLCDEFDCICLRCVTAQSFGQFGWPVWLNGWVFIYELSGCGFESNLLPSVSFDYEVEFECRCSLLNFRYCACFGQGVPWHSGN